jgi:hypothetical protein
MKTFNAFFQFSSIATGQIYKLAKKSINLSIHVIKNMVTFWTLLVVGFNTIIKLGICVYCVRASKQNYFRVQG